MCGKSAEIQFKLKEREICKTLLTILEGKIVNNQFTIVQKIIILKVKRIKQFKNLIVSFLKKRATTHN